jgi:hypothetical protein
VEGLILHAASDCNLIFVFFFSETQSSKPAAAAVAAASQRGSCKNQDSKTGENTTSSCSHTTETLHASSIQRRENFASYVCIYFFLFFEDDIQNQRSSCKTVHSKMVKKPTVSVPN